MTHTIQWVIPEKLIYVKLSGSITAAEVQDIANEMYAEFVAKKTPELVYQIIDASEASMANRIFEYARIKMERHSTVAWTVVIADMKLLGLFISIVSSIIPVHNKFVLTLEEAVKFIYQRDVSIASSHKIISNFFQKIDKTVELHEPSI